MRRIYVVLVHRSADKGSVFERFCIAAAARRQPLDQFANRGNVVGASQFF